MREDVLDEYVSLEAARERYGVVLTGSLEECDLEVDEEATAALREARSGAGCAEPEHELSRRDRHRRHVHRLRAAEGRRGRAREDAQHARGQLRWP